MVDLENFLSVMGFVAIYVLFIVRILFRVYAILRI